MYRNSVFVLMIVLLYLAISIIECKRYHGGGSKIHSPSIHRTPVHSSTSHRVTVRPIGFDPPRNDPSHYSPHHQAGTVRPLGFDPPSRPSAPIEPPKHYAPVQNAPHGTGTVRPLGFDTSGHHFSAKQHIEPPIQNTPVGHSPPYNQGQNPPAYNPHYNPAGYGPPPPYNQGHPPPYSPGGQSHYPQGGYHPQGGYQSNYHPQGGSVTIINNNINNHHHGGFGGGYSPPVYTTHDTGSTALGFFLGYSLAKITTPSFHYYNSYDNGPRYDHYTVHHYYHNRETVPAEATIQPNAIVACIGDSGLFCPANTTSLCTNNGAVMCVASAISTVPCSKEKQTNCVESSIPCKNNNATECKGSNQNTASVTIPCISTAKIYGNIGYVNNSIVITNYTTINNTAEANINTTPESNTNTKTTGPNTNITATSATPITVNKTDAKHEKSQMFCVTVLALPAKRKLSEGEKLAAGTKFVFSKFVIKAFGIE